MLWKRTGEWMCSFTYFYVWIRWEWVSWLHVPAAVPPGKDIWHEVCRILSGHQNRSGWTLWERGKSCSVIAAFGSTCRHEQLFALTLWLPGYLCIRPLPIFTQTLYWNKIVNMLYWIPWKQTFEAHLCDMASQVLWASIFILSVKVVGLCLTKGLEG